MSLVGAPLAWSMSIPYYGGARVAHLSDRARRLGGDEELATSYRATNG